VSAPLHLRDFLRRARWRRALACLSAGIVVVLAIVAVAWRASAHGVQTTGIAAVVAGVVVVALSFAYARRIDAAWVVRRLDAASPGLEDSSDLLLKPSASLNPLQRMQRERVVMQLARHATIDVREAWPWRPWFIAVAIAVLTALAAFFLPPMKSRSAAPTMPRSVTESTAGATTLVDASVRVTPPAYTGSPAHDEALDDLQVEQGAIVRWSLRFAPDPSGVALEFHDGSRLALARDGERWSGERVIDSPRLYGIALAANAPTLASARRYRLGTIADRAPEVRVITPDRTLTVLERGQPRWALAFEATDDYGLGDARLSITLAQGSGEQIAVTERSVVLRGEGDARRRQYRHALDLSALGFVQGDDVIVRLGVRDNHTPTPNETRSASFILRWPPPAASEGTGVEGLVERALPAYFRSQRQIIIDTEALLAEAPKLSRDALVARSDAIGVDQLTLRLRYGQFLGEESEKSTAVGTPHDDDAHAGEEHEGEHENGDTAESAPAPTAFGQSVDVLQAFGHAHDIAEAATLLDPKTRETLRTALNAMWQAELELRSGRPKAALPHEHEALRQIKLVQQAQRIYLARVGLELAAIDPARRLTGDRSTLRDRVDPLPDASADDLVVASAWQALRADTPPALDDLSTWLRAHESSLPDALSVYAALDALRADPSCGKCRDDLRDQLWPLLPQPVATVRPRDRLDATGAAYLDALESER
jgi:hypothetical protein